MQHCNSREVDNNSPNRTPLSKLHTKMYVAAAMSLAAVTIIASQSGCSPTNTIAYKPFKLKTDYASVSAIQKFIDSNGTIPDAIGFDLLDMVDNVVIPEGSDLYQEILKALKKDIEVQQVGVYKSGEVKLAVNTPTKTKTVSLGGLLQELKNLNNPKAEKPIPKKLTVMAKPKPTTKSAKSKAAGIEEDVKAESDSLINDYTRTADKSVDKVRLIPQVIIDKNSRLGRAMKDGDLSVKVVGGDPQGVEIEFSYEGLKPITRRLQFDTQSPKDIENHVARVANPEAQAIIIDVLRYINGDLPAEAVGSEKVPVPKPQAAKGPTSQKPKITNMATFKKLADVPNRAPHPSRENYQPKPKSQGPRNLCTHPSRENYQAKAKPQGPRNLSPHPSRENYQPKPRSQGPRDLAPHNSRVRGQARSRQYRAQQQPIGNGLPAYGRTCNSRNCQNGGGNVSPARIYSNNRNTRLPRPQSLIEGNSLIPYTLQTFQREAQRQQNIRLNNLQNDIRRGARNAAQKIFNTR